MCGCDWLTHQRVLHCIFYLCLNPQVIKARKNFFQDDDICVVAETHFGYQGNSEYNWNVKKKFTCAPTSQDTTSAKSTCHVKHTNIKAKSRRSLHHFDKWFFFCFIFVTRDFDEYLVTQIASQRNTSSPSQSRRCSNLSWPKKFCSSAYLDVFRSRTIYVERKVFLKTKLRVLKMTRQNPSGMHILKNWPAISHNLKDKTHKLNVVLNEMPWKSLPHPAQKRLFFFFFFNTRTEHTPDPRRQLPTQHHNRPMRPF